VRSAAVKVLTLGIIGLGILFAFFLAGQKDNRDTAIETQKEFLTIQAATPYDAIYQYYKALEGNNWDLVRSLTTQSLWEYIETSNFRSSWERRLSEDPTLRFELFIVKKQSIDEDEGEGWVLGKADWSSERWKVPDDNRIVYVEKKGKSWVIDKVIDLPSVEVVDDFYEAINTGDFAKAQSLTTRDYWQKLVASGVIRNLQKERSRFFGGVFVVFLVEDFSKKENEAWVTGDVSWKPLTLEQRETSVNVHVVRRNGWRIDNIVGDWDIEK